MEMFIIMLPKKNILILVFWITLFVGSIFITTYNSWGNIGLIFAILVLYYLYNYSFAKRRRKALKRLHSRDNCDLKKEYTIVASNKNIPLSEIECLWLKLSSFYGIPPTKLRSSDRLLVELSGLTNNPDYDICLLYDSCLTKTMHCNMPLAQDLLSQTVTWSDLISTVYRLEKGGLK